MRKLSEVITNLVGPLCVVGGLGGRMLDFGVTIAGTGIGGMLVAGGVGAVSIAAVVELAIQLRTASQQEDFNEAVAAKLDALKQGQDAAQQNEAANLADLATALREAGVDPALLGDGSAVSPLGMLAALMALSQEQQADRVIDALDSAIVPLVTAIETRFPALKELTDMELAAIREVREEVDALTRTLVDRASQIEMKADADRPFPALSLERSDLAGTRTIDLPNPFRAQSRRVPLFGRHRELAELWAFLGQADASCKWWLWHGPAGMGKTRLAHELCIDARASGWDAGFLKAGESFDAWENARLTRDTLIVIDYAAARPGPTARAIAGLAQCDRGGHRLRVLLLERDAGGRWWDEFTGDRTANVTSNLQHAPPRLLEPLVVRKPQGLELDLPAYVALLDHVLGDAGVPTDVYETRALLGLLRSIDPLFRPLYAAIVARTLADLHHTGDDNAIERLPTWGKEDLLRHVINAEVARWRDEPLAIPHAYTNAMYLARLRGGLDLKADRDLIGAINAEAREAGLTDGDDKLIPERARDANAWQRLVRFTGTNPDGDAHMPPLEPDLLGEFFVLERTNGHAHASPASDGDVRDEAAVMLRHAWAEAGEATEAAFTDPPEIVQFLLLALRNFPHTRR